MDRSLHRLKTAPDAALLQDLALATGTSLDLAANCDAFLEALLARFQFPYASVWVQSRYLGAGHPPDGYTLAQACPAFYAHTTHLPPEHPLLQGLGNAAVGTLSVQQAGLEGLPSNAPGGFVLLRLGDVGFLLLYDNSFIQPYSLDGLAGLDPVLMRFTGSLEQCLAHRYLLGELAERDSTVRRLRTAISRLSSVLGGLSYGVLVENESAAVALVNPAFCEMLGLSDSPEAMLGWDRQTMADAIRPHLAEPTTALAALRRLAEIGHEGGSAAFTLADGRTLTASYTPLILEDFRGHLWQYHETEAASTHARQTVPEEPPPSSLESRPTVTERVLFNPVALVEQVARQVRPAAEAKGLRLQVSLSPLLPERLVGEVKGLLSVLAHLVEQAVNHTHEGRVTLAATPVRQGAMTTRIQFAVIDTGAGLPHDRLAALLDEAAAPGGGVRGWTEAQGGHASAQSLKGRGSIVTLVLPFSHSEETPAGRGDGASPRLPAPSSANPPAASRPEP